MTPERIADYRNVAHAFGGSDGSVAGRVIAECLDEIERLQALHTDICDTLYGQGFDVLGWHLNGASEPMDNWFEENDWLDVESWQMRRCNDT